jgi:hypothetical protein
MTGWAVAIGLLGLAALLAGIYFAGSIHWDPTKGDHDVRR